jgi:hypothetical protein
VLDGRYLIVVLLPGLDGMPSIACVEEPEPFEALVALSSIGCLGDTLIAVVTKDHDPINGTCTC